MLMYGVPFDHIEQCWTWSDIVGLIAVATEEPKQRGGGIPLSQLIGR